MKTLLFVGHTPLSLSSYGSIIRKLMLGLGKDFNVEALGLFPQNKSTLIKDFPYPIIECGGYSEQDLRDGYDTFISQFVFRNNIPDYVIVIDDAYNMGRYASCIHRDKYKLILYSPIDSYPWEDFQIDILLKADIPVVYTKESRDYLIAKTGTQKRIEVVPAGADPTIFRPLPLEQKREIRKEFENNPEHLALFVGRNQTRKQNWQLFEVLARINYGAYYQCSKCGKAVPHYYSNIDYETFDPKEDLQREELLNVVPAGKFSPCCGASIEKGTPIDLSLYCHTPLDDERMVETKSAFLLTTYIKKLGLQNKVYFKQDFHSLVVGISDEQMNELYNVADFMLYLSGGEGFGMPCVEAMLSGLPIIYTDYTTHSHFTKGIPASVHTKYPEHAMKAFRGIVAPWSAISAIKEALSVPQTNLDRIREYAKEKFSWEVVIETWQKILNTPELKKTTNPKVLTI